MSSGRLADVLIKKNMCIELEFLYSTSVGNRKPDIVAKDASGVVSVLDVQIVSALAGLPTETKLNIIRETPVWWAILCRDLASRRAPLESRTSHSRGRECGGIKRWHPSSSWVYSKRH